MNLLPEKLHRYGFLRSLWFALSEIRLVVYNRWLLGSFSQVYEDLTLDGLTGYKKSGLYVDIGAYDPYRFSNTMRFYRRGWRGINIEPDTERWSKFIRKRSGDINLNVGVAANKGNMTYWRIDPPTLSTFDERQARAYQNQGFTLISKTKVPVLPLREILRVHVRSKRIDFMSVDVEGMEMQVLESNDWKLFRPHVICIESADCSKTNEGKGNYIRSGAFFKKAGYEKVSDNGLNSFYRDISHG